MDPAASRIPTDAPSSKNLANTAFAGHNSTLPACHGLSQPVVIDISERETNARDDFGDKLTRQFTLRPTVDNKKRRLNVLWLLISGTLRKLLLD